MRPTCSFPAALLFLSSPPAFLFSSRPWLAIQAVTTGWEFPPFLQPSAASLSVARCRAAAHGGGAELTGVTPSSPAQPVGQAALECLLSFETKMNRNVYVFKTAMHFKGRNIFLISFRFISFKFNQRKHFWFLKPGFPDHPLPPATGISKPLEHTECCRKGGQGSAV